VVLSDPLDLAPAARNRTDALVLLAQLHVEDAPLLVAAPPACSISQPLGAITRQRSLPPPNPCWGGGRASRSLIRVPGT
jgi:hypothetical protein